MPPRQTEDARHRAMIERALRSGLITRLDIQRVLGNEHTSPFSQWMLNPQLPTKRATIQDIIDIYYGDNGGDKRKRKAKFKFKYLGVK